MEQLFDHEGKAALSDAVLTLANLNRQLAAPARKVGITDLLVAFRSVQLTAIISGAGLVAEHPGLLQKLRGAFGTALLGGACASSAQGKCTCHPACAAAVLFAPKPRVMIDGITMELSKPHCISAQRHGSRDLALNVTLFGFSTFFAGVVRQAFGHAVVHGVPWAMLAKDVNLSLPSSDPSLVKMSARETGSLVTGKVPQMVTLDFQTGIELNNRDEQSLSGEDIFRRLIVRPPLLAPWLGIELLHNLDHIEKAWRQVDMNIDTGTPSVIQPRASRRTGQSWESKTLRPIVTLNGKLAEVWPYIVLGERTHIGRGAVSGAGRYVLA